MCELPKKANITDCASNKSVTADYIRLTQELAKEKISARWWKCVHASLEQCAIEGDYHWDWPDLVECYGSDPSYFECVAIQTSDREIQGAMIYRMNASSYLERGSGCIYVEYIATAPWNREWLEPKPKFRRVGSKLMLLAIVHSYRLGLKGRLNLASLPTPSTIEWYRQRRFIETGLVKDGMMVYELPSQAASDLLHKEGVL